jgi:hypothetical protein
LPILLSLLVPRTCHPREQQIRVVFGVRALQRGQMCDAHLVEANLAKQPRPGVVPQRCALHNLACFCHNLIRVVVEEEVDGFAADHQIEQTLAWDERPQAGQKLAVAVTR